VRVGCDGIAGSGLTNDECGICGGDGTHCASCTASQQYYCLRDVDINAEVDQDINSGSNDVQECKDYITRQGGRVLIGAVFVENRQTTLENSANHPCIFVQFLIGTKRFFGQLDRAFSWQTSVDRPSVAGRSLATVRAENHRMHFDRKM
jgi:hypothetical protein